jgi:hypothetical protein
MQEYSQARLNYPLSQPARKASTRGWQHWTPYAAVVWSVLYAILGIYWVASGQGFPQNPDPMAATMGPLLMRLGTGAAWIAIFAAGIPAVWVGIAMLRGARGRWQRPLLITTGGLLAGVLLLLMTGLDMLVSFGYIPYGVYSLITGGTLGQRYLAGLMQGTMIHQGMCLTGGFLWLAATVSYARRSGDACLYCGRGDATEGWTSPERAARWGRTAVIMTMIAPIFYAITRYAWALGFPLGMSEAALRSGQESHMWTSGLFLANFGLVGMLLTLGLVQRWGEVFPRWMIGLAGKRVPIALAVVPVGLVSVLLIVGGSGIWSSLGQMGVNLQATGPTGFELVWEVFIQLGPTMLFPVWGAALAVAALGYYFRRRGPCKVCGRGLE